MKKLLLVLFSLLLGLGSAKAQSPITAQKVLTYNAAFDQSLPDSVKKKLPYSTDLGVRRCIVADARGDGSQVIIATDYSNGGRVHVLSPSKDDPKKLEVIWSSPVVAGDGGSTPRFPQVGDCDGDGNPEIIFENYALGLIELFEWDPAAKTWGTEPAFTISSADYKAAGGSNTLRFTRENLTVGDFDGDGRSEIIPHTYDESQRDVVILGVDGDFPGFASLKIEGGLPLPNPSGNGHSWATGSYWNSIYADINGDGKKEIVNHHWNNLGFWSIQPKGTDSYQYPDTTGHKDYYHSYNDEDANSYFGVIPVDVDGDGKYEIAGTRYTGTDGTNFDMFLLNFAKADTGVYIWSADPQKVSDRFGIIQTNAQLSALGGKKYGEFWPVAKGDLNKDGKEEIYTGGGSGLNLIAVQYKGTGKLTDPASYTSNLVYNGEGGNVFATYNVYHGHIDTVITAKDTTYQFNPSKIDTQKVETPFTSWIAADKVDLDKNGKYEIVLAEQSVYDSTSVVEYFWVDSTKSWERNNSLAHKILNPYRETIHVLEYTGTSGLQDQHYAIIRPEDYKLEQNYPNPFNPTTNIRFKLPINKDISLKIYDMLGREVKTLINNQNFKTGSYNVQWDGTNSFGGRVASGNYIARLIYGNYQQNIKMTLLK